MGVDWDKYGAGPSIAILEVPGEEVTDPRFRNGDIVRARLVFREEIPRSEFVLLEAV